MKRSLSIMAAGTGIAALAVSVAAWADQPASGTAGAFGGKTIAVIEHATTDATTDTGKPGDSAGDVLTFANKVFDAADAKQAGTDQGYCLRVKPGVSYECTWTMILPGGQIVVAGPFYDAKDSTLAITGGTGSYRNARGMMKLHALANGAKYSFVYKLSG